MTDARDELIVVIAEALEPVWSFVMGGPVHPHATPEATAQAVLAALIERYGEPEIDWRWGCNLEDRCKDNHPRKRRLVFPWKAVAK